MGSSCPGPPDKRAATAANIELKPVERGSGQIDPGRHPPERRNCFRTGELVVGYSVRGRYVAGEVPQISDGHPQRRCDGLSGREGYGGQLYRSIYTSLG